MTASATAAATGRCATCRHWESFEAHEKKNGRDAGRHVDTTDATERNRLGLCGKILSRREFDAHEAGEQAQETKALVEDLSDCCGLRTAADFGCILWVAASVVPDDGPWTDL